MLRRSAVLGLATGSGCKRGAWLVVVGMGGSRPGVGAWVGSFGPASAGTSAEIRPFLPAWTDDRCHALTSSASRNHPRPAVSRALTWRLSVYELHERDLPHP